MKSCKQCDEYDVCSRQNDLRRKKPRCPKAKTDKPMTRFDWIKSLNMEELAFLIGNGCPPACVKPCREYLSVSGDTNCADCWLSWLKSPAEEGEG